MYINRLSFDMAGNDKIMLAWISKQNLTDVAKQLKHNNIMVIIFQVSPPLFIAARGAI